MQVSSARALARAQGPSLLSAAGTALRRSFSAAAAAHGSDDHIPIVTAAPSPTPKNVSILEVQKMHNKRKPITMVTAYDFPSAVHADKAKIDIVLIGDSVGMVELGYETTQPVTMDTMIHHCQAVSRGCRRPLLVGDMPFGSYEHCNVEATRNAHRFIKEGNVDCVKLEGGLRRQSVVRDIVDSGVAVMGHIGLTPQAFSALGGFRSQGRSAEAAVRVIEDALAIQEAGAFAVVIECVPPVVAREVSRALTIPTIGIGSGPHVSGQVLVYHDLLGMMQHHHHGKVSPKFCKQYAQVGVVIQEGLEAYRDDVESGRFPSDQFSPYKMPAAEEEKFVASCEEMGGRRRHDSGRSPLATDVDAPTTRVY